MGIPRAWASDLAVLRLGGSVIEPHADHVIVASPQNPGFHWGNFVLVTDAGAGHDLARWVACFDEHFPEADHLAIGLPLEPDRQRCAEHRLVAEAEVVLVAAEAPAGPALPDGYLVRGLREEDWAAVVDLDLREDGTASPELGEPGPGRSDPAHRLFLQRRTETRRRLVAGGHATFLGAFAPDRSLAAVLGIVLCGPVGGARQLARYQHVVTAAEHRRRGLASHLLAAAGRWAAERGADAWEIHADPGTAAHRLYDRLGFGESCLLWEVSGAPGSS
ncbi:MAG: GNAT family N-acetyltransferase [Candidatus Nanopelagicales bacterium]|jgi:GNAT superfamily N-acetyltransferase|nr:GNAT family N-acetyltransferase [Candidatus Nanopelagicales bacterium]